MVIDAGLFTSGLYALLDQMYEVGRSELTEPGKTFGTRVDREANVVVLDDPGFVNSAQVSRDRTTYSGTAGATMLRSN